MQIIVPMAGLGQRFADAGYRTPKPLIPISGLPMVVRVVHDLPSADRVIFVVNGDHVGQHRIDKTLRRNCPGCEIVVTPGLTEGQACTVRLAKEVADLADDCLVAACDATHVYDTHRFDALRHDRSIDCQVWTYHGEPRVLTKPTAYGWVQTASTGLNIEQVSCKKPISNDLLSDPVASGFFWFRSGELLFDSIDELVAKNWRINNEFYLDVVPNLLIAHGRRVVNFEVEKYIGWGTPHDFEDYQRWERYFAGNKSLAAVA